MILNDIDSFLVIFLLCYISQTKSNNDKFHILFIRISSIGEIISYKIIEQILVIHMK